MIGCGTCAGDKAIWSRSADLIGSHSNMYSLRICMSRRALDRGDARESRARGVLSREKWRRRCMQSLRCAAISSANLNSSVPPAGRRAGRILLSSPAVPSIGPRRSRPSISPPRAAPIRRAMRRVHPCLTFHVKPAYVHIVVTLAACSAHHTSRQEFGYLLSTSSHPARGGPCAFKTPRRRLRRERASPNLGSCNEMAMEGCMV